MSAIDVRLATAWDRAITSKSAPKTNPVHVAMAPAIDAQRALPWLADTLFDPSAILRSVAARSVGTNAMHNAHHAVRHEICDSTFDDDKNA
jgi:hypothetical protein